MKRATLLYGLLLCCLQTTFAQVHPGNLAIDEQSDIDSFAYTSIDGDLIIQEKSAGAIVDLHELLTLTSINGNLRIIANGTLPNLDGLSNLTDIGFGSITISNNSSLNNINGLSGITTITERLVIEDNSILGNLNGLSNVSILDAPEGFSLRVKRNPNLLNGCGIIPILTYDPSYVQVYPSINNNSANTSSVQDIIANCNTCKIYEGNLILTSQAQVDTFDYCEITGNLTIQEDVAGDITDLSSLATLEILGGGLYIKNNTSITNLDAFHNLKTINGSLELSKNAILANIDGLSSIEIIKGNLMISINKKITSLSAFNTLTTLNGNLNLLANEGLTDLDGFVNLKQIGGFLEIKGHRSMVSFTGLSNLTTIGTDIRIIGNDLSNLDGLTKLNKIKGNLELTNNFKLSDIHVFANVFSIKELRIKNNNLTDLSGFSGLKDAGAIILNNCDIINLNDLSNLTSLANRLVLYNNKNLENISGISNAIGKNIIQLEIGGNPNLVSLSGVENLEVISSFVSIFNNQKLKDLDALSNLSKIIKNLEIRDNPRLENACGIVQLLEDQNAVEGNILISNNTNTTNSIQNITDNCNISNGDVILRNQSDINSFNYYKINGDLIIEESSPNAITNLNALLGLYQITGNLSIKSNAQINNLDGLTNLIRLDGDFILHDNSELSNVGNFSELIKIGGKLSVTNNPYLTRLQGLSALQSIGGDLDLSGNLKLSNLYGLSNLTKINGDIFIDNNQGLLGIDGLTGITHVRNNLTITNNSILYTLDGLSNISEINGDLIFKNNIGIQNACGIAQIVEDENAISGLINISNNGSKANSALKIIKDCRRTFIGDLILRTQAEVDVFNYEAITGSLTVIDGDIKDITSIETLETLRYIGGDLTLEGNDLLSDIYVLGSIKTIGGKLILDNNIALPDNILGLTIDYFLCNTRIVDIITYRENSNSGLTDYTRDLDKICRPFPGGGTKNPFKTRETNGSKIAIQVVKKPTGYKQIILYPTVSKGDQINISGLKTDFTYSIYSIAGQLIEQNKMLNSSQNTIIYFKEQLKSGMYFIRIQEEERVNTLRFIVK
ncbi:T9SS type A sorting domain-containing protein [Aquimarina algiphila]|uniref:T9SS type A sorting domain-containing protein n=1 Tax=Aquimarina algiphila TaxID=2047982 RepID=UPI00248FDE7D|nr:T9SS type A sorting domain-containing protein [Aquimarina algiphila]